MLLLRLIRLVLVFFISLLMLVIMAPIGIIADVSTWLLNRLNDWFQVVYEWIIKEGEDM